MSTLIGRLVNDSPVPLTGTRRTLTGMSGRGRTDRAAQLESIMALSTLYKVVAKRASSIAQVEWRLYKTPPASRRTRTATTETDERIPVDTHLALDVWNSPSKHVKASTFRKRWSMHMDLTGEAYILPAVTPGMGGAPTELWWARPDRMAPIKHPTRFLDGWEYRTPDGKTQHLNVDEVHQFLDPDPSDDYRGLGPIQSLMVDVQGGRAMADWNRNLFINGVELGGVIEAPDGLTDDEFTNLRDQLDERHKGVHNAHRWLVLEHGKAVPNTATMRDMQFADGRNFTRDVVREAFAMPKILLGIGESVNRATANAAWAIYLEQETSERLDDLKMWLNRTYLPMFGATARGMEFDYVDPVPTDNEAANAELTAKTQAAKLLKDAGWDPVQVLQTVGLPAMDLAEESADEPAPVFASTNGNGQRPKALI